MVNAVKEESSSSVTWAGAAKRNCGNTSNLLQRCGPTWRSMSYTRSSACLRMTARHAQRRCDSSCASPSLKDLTGPCMPRSNMRSTGTPRFTSSRQPLTSKGGCRPTRSTTTEARQSRDGLRRSSASGQTDRAMTRCRAPPRRASGSNTSEPENSARCSDYKPSSTWRWIAKSLSPNSNRD